ncbi:hypothetical protein [Corynebacterium sp. p3-SID1194]|uniref:hypothetical protein n=1 Tax=Corynebacterium sp. p3-SID1194 TaxID=2916105 RepID=UPI0021A4B6FD|nr:hypothetical protein [Corynebacterium sp. p3-SID1194]MCT1451273.1 hypothetical protein [Corynebacterium sp. p3-SID1194]
MQPAPVLIGCGENDEHGADIFVLLALARRRLHLYQVDPGRQTIEAYPALLVTETGERRVSKSPLPGLVHGQAESAVVAFAGPNVDVGDPLEGEGIATQRARGKLSRRYIIEGVTLGKRDDQAVGFIPDRRRVYVDGGTRVTGDHLGICDRWRRYR